MTPGIFAKTFNRASAGEALTAARNAGFRTVQFNMACAGLPSMPDQIPASVLEAVREAIRKTPMPVAGLSGTFNMIHPDPAVRRTGLQRLEVLAAACPHLGTNLITLCTGSRDPEDQWRAHPGNRSAEAWRDLLESLETALDIAERHDLLLGIEPELGNVISSTARARRLLDELQSPRLRIVFDPANLFEQASAQEIRHQIARGIDELAESISMVHIKDRTASGGFCAAGKGIIPFDFLIGLLRKSGFDGPLVAHGLDEGEADEVARFILYLSR